MKTVVSLQDLLEYEIRPGELLREYQRLTAEAVRAWPRASFREVPCPACRGTAVRPAFARFELAYVECTACGTVFLSPRPGAEVLANHARSSPAADFWREHVLASTEDVRREKILVPRAEWVADSVAEFLPQSDVTVDLAPLGEPSSLAVHPDDSIDVVTAFEAFDRTADLPVLMEAIRRVLRPGGLLFVTAPSVSGFELQALWERAQSITPPDKINLLSIAGFRALFSAGWELLELSTPGMFDVEMVRRAMAQDPGGGWPRILHMLVQDADEPRRLELQEYLQRARQVSFARLVARRLPE